MKRQQLHSFLLIGIVLLSSIAVFGAISVNFDNGAKNTQNYMTINQEQPILEENLKIDEPNSAAFYRGLEFDTKDTFSVRDISPSADEDTFVTDVAETSTSYYFTGYTFNGATSSNNLFVLKTDKSGTEQFEVLWQCPLNTSEDTGGLAIDVDEANNRIFVGGYYILNPTASARFPETYGSGIVVCFNSISWAVNWWQNISYSLNTTWSDTVSSQRDFGGERIEDVKLMPDGNLTITGSYAYYTGGAEDEGINTLIMNLDGDDGSTVWEYQYEYTHSGDLLEPNTGKTIYYRESSDVLFILCEKRSFQASIGYCFNQFITAIYYYTQDSALNPSSGDVLFIRDLTANDYNWDPLNDDYYKVCDLTFDSEDELWVSGYDYEVNPGEITSPLVWKLYDSNGVIISNYDLGPSNRSANFIRFDDENTMYLTGTILNNVSGVRGVWITSYDLDQSMSPICDITDFTVADTEISALIFDTVSKSFSIFGYMFISGHGYYEGFIMDINSAALGSTRETLSEIDPIINTNIVNLEWTNSYSEIRYFYVFRDTSPIITLGDLTGLSPIASLTDTYSYTDSSSKLDTQYYYYALLCGNDYDNSSTLEIVSTQFYSAPATPIGTAASNPIIYGNNVQINWVIISNASISVYASKTWFSANSLEFMSPIATLPVGSNNISHHPTSLGNWYYMIQAVNETRGNSTSPLITVSVENIAQSPDILAADVDDSENGVVTLDWNEKFQCRYVIYRSNRSFTINSPTSYYEYVTTITDYRTSRYQVTDLPSGRWYFAIWSMNSTGNATSFSPNNDVLIERIPDQPSIWLTTSNPHHDVVGLAWDPVDEAEWYAVYRVRSESGTDPINTVTGLTPIYNGSEVTYTDLSPKEEGFYIYCIVAGNDNGFHQPDNGLSEKYVSVYIKIDEVSLWDNGILSGIIIAVSIVSVVVIGYVIYKKRNPWA